MNYLIDFYKCKEEMIISIKMIIVLSVLLGTGTLMGSCDFELDDDVTETQVHRVINFN